MKFKLNLRQIRKIILVFCFTLLIGGTGYWLGSRQFSFSWFQGQPSVKINRQTPANREVDFSLFWQVWDELEKSYFDQKAINPSQMVYGAIRGMVNALGDPYTVFLPPEDNQQTKEELEGSFEGVGIQLGFKDGSMAVIAPLSGTPAERAGVKAGDLILRIEDQETTDISLPEAVKLIRGPKGTTVKLTLLHEGENQPYEVLITRDTILISSVEVAFIGDESGRTVAHLKLMRFGERTNGEWEGAVNQIVQRCGAAGSGACQGLILDLRNNPGGYFGGSVYAASEFLKSGVVVIEERSDGQQKTYSVDRQGKLTAYPLVVLVNQGSASASEIVAGALRELAGARIVGEPTFGKGTIQEAQDLGDNSGLHITVARWLLPSGESIDKEGLTPDNQISDNPETEADEQLQQAIDLLD